MPKISQYTVVEPQGEDKIIITQTIGSPEDATKNITIDDLKEYINQGGGGGNGVASLNTLTGNVTLVAGANVIIANDLNDTLTISVPNVVDKTTDQTIDGIKTFEKPIFLDDIVTQGNTLKIEFVSGTFRVTRNNNNSFFGFQNSFFEFNNNNGRLAKFDTSLITGAREYFFPDKDGTIALTSDIADVNEWSSYLGNWSNDNGNLLLGDVNTEGSGTKILVDDINLQVEIQATEGTIIRNHLYIKDTATIYSGDVTTETLTDNRIYALPDANGTIALTSDIADVSEWAESTGTRAGGDLRLILGDYDESSNGTRISIKDNDSLVDIYGEVKFYNNPSLMNDAGTFGSRLSASNITSNKTLLIPDSDGTIALTSDLSSLSGTQETTDFNATISQVGLMINVNSATDVVVTVRDFATEAIPVGSVLTYRQAGVGKISNAYSVATGDTSTTYREGDVLTLWQKSQDNWVVINPPHAIDSQTTGEPSGSDQVLNVVSLTQAEYDAAIGTYNTDTLYVITS